ncbi:rhodanese-like domain-containing protein [Phragmitibacter flavus]|uniref:Rhodanese-like domain-containing protein n=2 Tax=Phragmitibacter flavus TaxID=2576071 RepID=A0A5R8KJS0_9BACT|nr:rhodanese-like domain-containing protein [Phragmitibacter flavus]
MGELLRLYPGAQRALFAKFHVGGCRSCGFSPSETLGQVCARNEDMALDEAIVCIQSAYEADASLQISPQALVELRETRPEVKLLDVRTREEHEAVAIAGSQLMTQELMQEVFISWDKQVPVVIYDHQGDKAMDAAAYFLGHGFSETKCLAGGIDAYSLEVDQTLPRYRLEMEE